MNRFIRRARNARRPGKTRRWSTPAAASAVLAAAAVVAGPAVPAVAGTASLVPAPASGQAVAAWGQNDRGQLGNGTSGGTALAPVLATLPPGTRISQVAPGCNHSLALTSAGTLLAWGDNSDGELGNGFTGGFETIAGPVKLPAGVTVRAISAGCGFSLAIATNGTLYSWGDNSVGQLGNTKTGGNSALPAPVQLPSGVTVRAAAGGQDHTLAVTSNGEVLAWGDDGNGQLGTGPRQHDSAFPEHVKLPNFGRAVAVGGGCVHSVAVTGRGQVLAWGSGTLLGNGSQTSSPVPVTVRLPAGQVAIGTGGSAVGDFSLALLR